MFRSALALSIVLLLLPACQTVRPAPDYERWSLLENPFESTTGGGVMIDGYDPVVGEQGGRRVCTTDYSVRSPGRPVLYSEIVFEAMPVQGGVLCRDHASVRDARGGARRMRLGQVAERRPS